MTQQNRRPIRRRRLARQLQPYALVLLGGLLTLLGQCSTSWNDLNRFKYEATLSRRTEAMSFLDNFARTNAERIFSATEYQQAIVDSESQEELSVRKSQYLEDRKAAIIQEGIFISRGNDFFGAEFKDTLYKELFVVLADLDEAIISLETTRSDEQVAKVSQLITKANLLDGMLLGPLCST